MQPTNKTILLVEDDNSLLQPLSDHLSEAGFNIIQAQDGETGLDLALKNHPDLIMADIVMPKMNGLVMLEKLRQDPWGKNVQVIMLTNFSSTDNISAAMVNHVFDYIVKSDWSLEEVVKKVKEKLEQK